MKIHEYQAKELLRQHGIEVPQSFVATTAEDVAQQITQLGGRGVVKAQVHAGGRGKAGGVKVVSSPDEGRAFAESLLGSRLVTHQTGPQGVPVDKVLVEEAVTIVKELYLSILVDPAARLPVVIASEAGGMEIEQVAEKSPGKILTIPIDPTTGFQPFMGRNAAYGLNLSGDLVRSGGTLVTNLYRLFESLDCSLAEINPLVITQDNRLLAADAKLTFDDDAMRRHKNIAELRDVGQEDPLDVQASEYEVNYIRLDGDVGCMVNGAGLAMATMDIIKLMGAEPANFLDVGGGASEEQVDQAFKILLDDHKVKRVLVNVFGGILRCDVCARGIVSAAKERGITIPLVVRMRGTNAEEGKRILAESGLTVIIADDLQEAAEKVVTA